MDIAQINITHRNGRYFVCGYCGTGCHHGTYCGCAASREEVRGTLPQGPSLDEIELVLPEKGRR